MSNKMAAAPRSMLCGAYLFCVLFAVAASVSTSDFHHDALLQPSSWVESGSELHARGANTVVGLQINEATEHVKHKTDRYRYDDPKKPVNDINVLRRGNSVDIVVTVASPLHASEKIVAGLINDRLSSDPQIKATKAEAGATKITVTVPIACNEIVGTYYAFAKVMVDSTVTSKKAGSWPVYLILNPYNEKCDEFAPEDLRKEYVENEKGAVWKGSSQQFFWAPWAFDQFNLVILQKIMKLLEKENRAELLQATTISRLLATKMSSVLTGKWSPPYDDGTLPENWVSTADILRKYELGKPAKYGQCMVFACLTAGVLRAFGFAARPLTIYNFMTNPDKKELVSIEWDLDEKTKSYVLNPKNRDKAWWFHVVTETYMKRPDLKLDAGWQTVDGTWASGPASAVMFKKGDKTSNYDTWKYYYAMSVKAEWRNFNPATKKYDIVIKDPFIVGDKMLTKSPDANCNIAMTPDGTQYTSLCYLDQYSQYKSEAPRFMQRLLALEKPQSSKQRPALPSSGDSEAGWKTTEKDGFTFKSFIPTSKMVGSEFTLRLNAAKVPSGATVTRIVITTRLQMYNGDLLPEGGLVKSLLKENPSESEMRQQLTISGADDWKAMLANLKFTRSMAVTFQVNYKTKGSTEEKLFFEERNVVLMVPSLNMLCGKLEKKVGDKISCTISLFNPMPFPLGPLKLNVRITGQGDEVITRTAPGAAAKTTGTSHRVMFDNVSLTTKVAGSFWVLAQLESAELPDVSGVSIITVK